VIRVNSQSGKGGIAFVLERDYGLSLPRWLQQALAPVVQRESERARRHHRRRAHPRCSASTSSATAVPPG
jgi:isopropylmalate/homocitrate/citramalate synthase